MLFISGCASARLSKGVEVANDVMMKHSAKNKILNVTAYLELFISP
jgi:hypothetical protein